MSQKIDSTFSYLTFIIILTWKIDMLFKEATIISMLCIIFVVSIDPPVLPNSFQIAFDETFIQNGTHYRINGQTYY